MQSCDLAKGSSVSGANNQVTCDSGSTINTTRVIVTGNAAGATITITSSSIDLVLLNVQVTGVSLFTMTA
jgi:hypothetical protein